MNEYHFPHDLYINFVGVYYYIGIHTVKTGRFYKLTSFILYVLYLVCSSGEFQCLSGTCISHSLKCNGVKNCQYNEDELFCSK